MLNTLKTLCSLPGVSGMETAVRDYIAQRAKPFASEISTDPMGNLIVFKEGKNPGGKKIMLCAHMDEVGVMVTYIDDNGYLKFDTVGGIARGVLIGKRVIIGDGIPGIIGIKAVHLTNAKERKAVPSLDDMYIDIGAGSREKAEELISLGDVGCFDSEPREFGNGFLKARAADDRVGCALMLHLLELDLPVSCHFVFTVQEEVGCRGASVAAYRVKPDIALVLEGTTSAAMPDVVGNKKICSPGGGVVLPFMDGGTIYDPALRKWLTGLADSNGIPWQTKQYIAGGTDGSVVQRSGTGVRTAAMAAALLNIHTPSGIMCIKDMDCMYNLAKLFLENIGDFIA